MIGRLAPVLIGSLLLVSVLGGVIAAATGVSAGAFGVVGGLVAMAYYGLSRSVDQVRLRFYPEGIELTGGGDRVNRVRWSDIIASTPP